jgi:serine/threonine protein kinase
VSLNAGARIGAYEVLSALGARGMGEVYRARDTKLNRDVALKILPVDLALDADRRARFTREAQVLASLNHPNIAAIYGFEDSGDIHALVLELVDGETLADRIARGAIPIDEALPIAGQICEALEAAHEHGIIHRSQAVEHEGATGRRRPSPIPNTGTGSSANARFSPDGRWLAYEAVDCGQKSTCNRSRHRGRNGRFPVKAAENLAGVAMARSSISLQVPTPVLVAGRRGR